MDAPERIVQIGVGVVIKGVEVGTDSTRKENGVLHVWGIMLAFVLGGLKNMPGEKGESGKKKRGGELT